MNPEPHTYVLLNGALVRAEDATVPVTDRAFRYGDGLFETLRVTQGAPEFWQAHLARLRDGLKALSFPALPLDLLAAARTLLEANQVTDGVLRIAISRGSGGHGYLPPEHAAPRIVIESSALPVPPKHPLTLWHSSLRRPGPEHLPTRQKLSNALGSVLARLEAQEQRCDEALLTDGHGYVSEASAANLVWQEASGRFCTPALESGAVAGIARHALMTPLEIEPCLAPLERLRAARAVILCNSLRHAQPVAALRPMDWHWDSAELAARCNAILAQAAQASRTEWP